MSQQDRPTKERLDATDKQLLNFLQEDGRITNADLARKVNLSPPSVLQRVRRLEESGLVDKYVAVLNPERLGYQMLVFAQVSLALHHEQPIEAFRSNVLEIGQVLECHHVSGDFDFLLKIIVPDMKSYEELIRTQLSNIPGVGKIQSSFVMATNKSTTVLPL
jgi:Lrp/AsnC family transcriptional regulator, leucine-responsive regulatory protein